jgi:hypothetical protein
MRGDKYTRHDTVTNARSILDFVEVQKWIEHATEGHEHAEEAQEAFFAALDCHGVAHHGSFTFERIEAREPRCDYPEKDGGFWCATHGCGVKKSGAIVRCKKDGCPHCGKKKPTPNVTLLMRRRDAAQARFHRWLPRLQRASNEVASAIAEINRLAKKLEAAGVYVDAAMPDDVTQIPQDDGE